MISEHHNAFIQGRQIYDNVVAAKEIIHTLRKKKKGKLGSVAIKLDMSKAFDRIKEKFVEAIMEKLRFPNSFSSLIMSCISSVQYSVVVKGESSSNFSPSRGIR